MQMSYKLLILIVLQAIPCIYASQQQEKESEEINPTTGYLEWASQVLPTPSVETVVDYVNPLSWYAWYYKTETPKTDEASSTPSPTNESDIQEAYMLACLELEQAKQELALKETDYSAANIRLKGLIKALQSSKTHELLHDTQTSIQALYEATKQEYAQLLTQTTQAIKNVREKEATCNELENKILNMHLAT